MNLNHSIESDLVSMSLIHSIEVVGAFKCEFADGTSSQMMTLNVTTAHTPPLAGDNEWREQNRKMVLGRSCSSRLLKIFMGLCRPIMGPFKFSQFAYLN